jgi:hypothetical protein
MHPITTMRSDAPGRESLILDCGHVPTPPTVFYTNGTPITTGYALTSEERVICYACAQQEEIDLLKTADRAVGYLTRAIATGRWQVTTWTGGQLMTVDRNRYGAPHMSHARVGFRDCSGRSPERYTVHATDVHGQKWIGIGPGEGMYLRLRRAKR